jgi:hypothetical protein
LAPHKCAQIAFTKARDTKNDKLILKLYNVEIPEDQSPKFLGIVFGKRLNFSNKCLNKLKESQSCLSPTEFSLKQFYDEFQTK